MGWFWVDLLIFFPHLLADYCLPLARASYNLPPQIARARTQMHHRRYRVAWAYQGTGVEPNYLGLLRTQYKAQLIYLTREGDKVNYRHLLV